MQIIKKIFKYGMYLLISFLVLIVLAYTILSLATNPSNNRDWNVDQEVLSFAEVDGNLIHVKNIRNFSYTSTQDFTPNYYDKTFDINKLKRVYYIVEPFSGFMGSAHTFLSFEFEGSATNGNTKENTDTNDFLAVSVEIRKQKGESFSPIKGLFNQYELMYVLADERDVVKLRSNFRKDQVYVYPMKASREKTKALFLDMIKRVNNLKDNPEFYNTAFNSCTTNIMKHVNTVSPSKIPFSYKVLLPAYSDELAFALGLIDTKDTNASLSEVRSMYNINKRAEMYTNDVNFSEKIRQ